jgi:hypothetical protein
MTAHRWKIAALALLCLALSAPGYVLGQEEPAGSGSVTGVIELDGVPQVGAQVTASSSASSTFEAAGQTDPSGRFLFESVPLGTVSVKCYDAEGALLAEGQGVLTADGETLTVTVEPVP